MIGQGQGATGSSEDRHRQFLLSLNTGASAS